MNKYTIYIKNKQNQKALKTPRKEAKVQEPIQRTTKPWYRISYYSNSVETYTRTYNFHLH